MQEPSSVLTGYIAKGTEDIPVCMHLTFSGLYALPGRRALLLPFPGSWGSSIHPATMLLTSLKDSLPAGKWSDKDSLMPSLGDEEGHLPERASSQDSQGPHLQLALVNAQSQSLSV